MTHLNNFTIANDNLLISVASVASCEDLPLLLIQDLAEDNYIAQYR